MRTNTNDRRIRFPAPHEDCADELVELVFDDGEDAPPCDYLSLSRDYGLPALEIYLLELRVLGSRMIH